MHNPMNCLSAVKIVQNMTCLILVILNKHNSAESYEVSDKHNTVNCNLFEQNSANTITCHILTSVNCIFCPSKQCGTSKSVTVNI